MFAALVTVAAGSLVYSIIAGDYRMAYVWETSNKTMPIQYKFAAWWGGQAGSLLFWSWLLATYSAILVFQNRRKFRDMMPYVTAVLMATETFFLILISFVEQPFKVIMAGKGIVDVGDGQGLNPLLQYWTMVIHPPMLYLGYVGFAVVPFVALWLVSSVPFLLNLQGFTHSNLMSMKKHCECAHTATHSPFACQYRLHMVKMLLMHSGTNSKIIMSLLKHTQT